MKKIKEYKGIIIIVLLIIILGGFYSYKFWKSKQPCPKDDPIGLFTNCVVENANDSNNPLGI